MFLYHFISELFNYLFLKLYSYVTFNCQYCSSVFDQIQQFDCVANC